MLCPQTLGGTHHFLHTAWDAFPVVSFLLQLLLQCPKASLGAAQLSTAWDILPCICRPHPAGHFSKAGKDLYALRHGAISMIGPHVERFLLLLPSKGKYVRNLLEFFDFICFQNGCFSIRFFVAFSKFIWVNTLLST